MPILCSHMHLNKETAFPACVEHDSILRVTIAHDRREKWKELRMCLPDYLISVGLCLKFPLTGHGERDSKGLALNTKYIPVNWL